MRVVASDELLLETGTHAPQSRSCPQISSIHVQQGHTNIYSCVVFRDILELAEMAPFQTQHSM